MSAPATASFQTVAPAIAALVPGFDAAAQAEWTAAFDASLPRAGILPGITFNKRAAMFLGQCFEETGFVKNDLVENDDYRTAARIHAVWPDEFPTVASAEPYTNSPEALANRVYANKLGNGDEASGDGWRFRGRGAIQITGRSEYAACFAALGLPVDTDPDWLTTPYGAAMSAAWYWSQRGDLNEAADLWLISEVTLRINGSEGNEAARIVACNKALAALSAASTAQTATVQPKTFTPRPTTNVPSKPIAATLTADDLNAAELAGDAIPGTCEAP